MRKGLFWAAMAAAPLCAQQTLHLNLAEAERLALQNNPQLSAARFSAAAAHQTPLEYKAAYAPTFFGSITGVGADDGSRIAAGGLNNPVLYNRLGTGVSVGQMITDFGRTGNLVGAANATCENVYRPGAEATSNKCDHEVFMITEVSGSPRYTEPP